MHLLLYYNNSRHEPNPFNENKTKSKNFMPKIKLIADKCEEIMCSIIDHLIRTCDVGNAFFFSPRILSVLFNLLACFYYPDVLFQRPFHNVTQFEPLDWPFRQNLMNAHKLVSDFNQKFSFKFAVIVQSSVSIWKKKLHSYNRKCFQMLARRVKFNQISIGYVNQIEREENCQNYKIYWVMKA